MSPLLLILVIWFGVMLLSLGVMSALGLHSRRADQTADALLPAASAVSMSGIEVDTNVGVSLEERSVLQACRDCLSVVAGAYDTCPACGGALTVSRSLDGDRTQSAPVAEAPAEAVQTPGSLQSRH